MTHLTLVLDPQVGGSQVLLQLCRQRAPIKYTVTDTLQSRYLNHFSHVKAQNTAGDKLPIVSYSYLLPTDFIQ
jgi:hypothetical protein